MAGPRDVLDHSGMAPRGGELRLVLDDRRDRVEHEDEHEDVCDDERLTRLDVAKAEAETDRDEREREIQRSRQHRDEAEIVHSSQVDLRQRDRPEEDCPGSQDREPHVPPQGPRDYFGRRAVFRLACDPCGARHQRLSRGGVTDGAEIVTYRARRAQPREAQPRGESHQPPPGQSVATHG